MKKDDNLTIFILVGLFVFLFFVLFKFLYKSCSETFSGYSSRIYYNGKYLYITSDDEKTGEVIQRLKDVSDYVESIVTYCYENDFPCSERALRLKKRWSVVELYETSPDDENIAYLVDKSKILKLCLRNNYTKGEVENINTMMFVILHELAHMMSASYGHNDEFKTNFLELIKIANFLEIYDPVHYSETPTPYCNIIINTSPCEGDK